MCWSRCREGDVRCSNHIPLYPPRAIGTVLVIKTIERSSPGWQVGANGSGMFSCLRKPNTEKLPAEALFHSAFLCCDFPFWLVICTHKCPLLSMGDWFQEPLQILKSEDVQDPLWDGAVQASLPKPQMQNAWTRRAACSTLGVLRHPRWQRALKNKSFSQ